MLGSLRSSANIPQKPPRLWLILPVVDSLSELIGHSSLDRVQPSSGGQPLSFSAPQVFTSFLAFFVKLDLAHHLSPVSGVRRAPALEPHGGRRL